jgi:hypothetical protein
MKSECPNRSSLGEREKLSDRITELEEELGRMMKEADKHETSLALCQTLIKEENLLSRVL